MRILCLALNAHVVPVVFRVLRSGMLVVSVVPYTLLKIFFKLNLRIIRNILVEVG